MPPSAPGHDRVAAWMDALIERHTASLTTSELTRALRALSARYVERRAALGSRSPIDSAGKRAAFAVFYGPIHFLTTRAIVHALGAAATGLEDIVDLGCGTGVASAAWSLTSAGAPDRLPAIRGIDKDSWAMAEAAWNWRTLGLRGRTRRGDFVEAMEEGAGSTRRTASKPGSQQTGIIAGWSVNELDAPARLRLLPLLMSAARRGAPVLVIEPLARGVSPWWDEWAAAFQGAGGRADEWKFDEALPPRLAELDSAAGFHREALGARSLFANAGRPDTLAE